jgi:hypothetical protein
MRHIDAFVNDAFKTCGPTGSTRHDHPIPHHRKTEGVYGAPRVSITEKTQATVQTIIDVVNDYIEGKVRSG